MRRRTHYTRNQYGEIITGVDVQTGRLAGRMSIRGCVRTASDRSRRSRQHLDVAGTKKLQHIVGHKLGSPISAIGFFVRPKKGPGVKIAVVR